MDFNGYATEEFMFLGKSAKLVRPNGNANGRWALKTEYFGAFPETETELLRRGWHIAYNENNNRWAEDEDLERKRRFTDFVSHTFGLNEKCALVGMSCGGLYSVKLAALCPEKIAALYLDAPVLNLLSCPLALGAAEVSMYDEYHRFTGRTVSEMLSYRDHPIDKMDILSGHKIPVILVAGDSDKTVPFEENGALLEKHYREKNAPIEVYLKKNADHHPHGLDNVTVTADFLDAAYERA